MKQSVIILSGQYSQCVFSSDEKFFTYPINDTKYSEKYYVVPYLTNTDVFGQNLDTSEVMLFYLLNITFIATGILIVIMLLIEGHIVMTLTVNTEKLEE